MEDRYVGIFLLVLIQMTRVHPSSFTAQVTLFSKPKSIISHGTPITEVALLRDHGEKRWNSSEEIFSEYGSKSSIQPRKDHARGTDPNNVKTWHGHSADINKKRGGDILLLCWKYEVPEGIIWTDFGPVKETNEQIPGLREKSNEYVNKLDWKFIDFRKY